MSSDPSDIAETLHRLTGQSLDLCEAAVQLLTEAADLADETQRLRHLHAVRRAHSLVPLLTQVRDAGGFHLDTATRAADADGVAGALVLEVPRKANQPTEVTWVGGKPELRLG